MNLLITFYKTVTIPCNLRQECARNEQPNQERRRKERTLKANNSNTRRKTFASNDFVAGLLLSSFFFTWLATAYTLRKIENPIYITVITITIEYGRLI